MVHGRGQLLHHEQKVIGLGTDAGIFPIDIDPIQVVLIGKADHAVYKRRTSGGAGNNTRKTTPSAPTAYGYQGLYATRMRRGDHAGQFGRVVNSLVSSGGSRDQESIVNMGDLGELNVAYIALPARQIPHYFQVDAASPGRYAN